MLASALADAVPVQAQQPQKPAPAPIANVMIPKPAIDHAARCGVFVPPSVSKPTPHLKWSGACNNGLAEGRGTASLSASPGTAPQRVWQGNFRNGIFLGEANAAGAAVAISPYLAGIELIHTAPQEGRVWLRYTMTTDGPPLPLCSSGTAEVSFETPAILSDQARMRQAIELAITTYRRACPVAGAARVTVFTGGFYKPVLIARGAVEAGAPVQAMHSFQSLLPGEADPYQRSRLQEERLQDHVGRSRRNWQEFTRTNGVEVWVTPRQLEMSASRFEGKIVALPGRFNVVVQQGTAILKDDRWGMVVVTGLPNYVLQQGTFLIVAGRSQGKQKLPQSTAEIATVAATAWKICQTATCGEYLDWMAQEKSYSWGAEHSAFLK